jgi:hypothetical protein
MKVGGRLVPEPPVFPVALPPAFFDMKLRIGAAADA